MLTLEEQERAAYIRGDVALANVLGAAADLEYVNAELETEVEDLLSQRDNLLG